MANVLNRKTKEIRYSVNTPDYITGEWLINPDLSAVEGNVPKYWKIVEDKVVLMDTFEQEAVDIAEEIQQVEMEPVSDNLNLEEIKKEMMKQIDEAVKSRIHEDSFEFPPKSGRIIAMSIPVAFKGKQQSVELSATEILEIYRIIQKRLRAILNTAIEAKSEIIAIQTVQEAHLKRRTLKLFTG